MFLFPPVDAFMAPFSTATLACEIGFEKRAPAESPLNICNVRPQRRHPAQQKSPAGAGLFDRPEPAWY